MGHVHDVHDVLSNRTWPGSNLASQDSITVAARAARKLGHTSKEGSVRQRESDEHPTGRLYTPEMPPAPLLLPLVPS